MLPTHLVFFDVLEMVRNSAFCNSRLIMTNGSFTVTIICIIFFCPQELSTFLDGNRFMRSTEIFHTHVPEGRVGKSILVYQRHWTQNTEENENTFVRSTKIFPYSCISRTSLKKHPSLQNALNRTILTIGKLNQNGSVKQRNKL